MNFIPYGRQFIDRSDSKAVIKALKSEKITTGIEVKKFEKKISNYLKSNYVVSCNSGTSALFLALSAIGTKKDDIVIMPSVTFISSYNVAKLFGAKVFLADIDRNLGQMRPEDVVNCCKKFKLKKIKAIITMYNGGYPHNADKFFNLKKKYKTIIIEDACHALGSSYKFKKNFYRIGSCKHADISTFSLHPLKSITTGEGGIVTTNSKNIYDKLILLRSHGIKKNLKKHWEYDVYYNSLNFRLSDIQCALGVSQLNKIKKFILKRKKIAQIYNKYLSSMKDINLCKINKNYSSSFHLFIIHLNKKNIKEKLIKFMLKYRIILQYHYIPIYKFKIFKGKKISKNSEKYFQTAVSLPIYYNLSFKNQMFVIKKLREFFKFAK